MESMQFIRSQALSIVDLNFFLNEANLNSKYENDRIAQIVKGKIYAQTKKQVDDFIARCKQSLKESEKIVNDAKNTHASLVKQANTAKPGNAPSPNSVDNKNPQAIKKFHDDLNKHSIQTARHKELIEEVSQAKRYYDDAVRDFQDRKFDLDEQMSQKLKELLPALDQDINASLDKIYRLAHDNARNQERIFEAFLLIYVAKKAYLFLSRRINSPAEQRAAADISDKINDELDAIISTNGAIVKQGFQETAQFLQNCHQENAVLQKRIHDRLQRLPYQKCEDAEKEVNHLLNLSVDKIFNYKDIIDPAEMAQVEKNVQARRSEFENDIRLIDEFSSRFDPTFAEIAEIENFVESEHGKMLENKANTLDPVSRDIFFTFGIFSDREQKRYMERHEQWLQTTQKEIDTALNINLTNLVETVIKTELLTNSTRETINTDKALAFLSNKENIAQQKQQFLSGVSHLDTTLEGLADLPRKQSEKFSKKMSLYLNLSLLPLGNIAALFPINSRIKEYIPAFTSGNSLYLALKQDQIKRFQTYFYIHLALILVSGGISFLFAPPGQIALLIVAFTYIISSVVIFMKGGELKKF